MVCPCRFIGFNILTQRINTDTAYHSYFWFADEKLGYGFAPAGYDWVTILTGAFVPGKVKIENEQAGTCWFLTSNPLSIHFMKKILDRERLIPPMYSLWFFNCHDWDRERVLNHIIP